MEIDRNNNNCTVIVSVDGDVKDIESVLNHVTSGLDLFNEFDGFIAGATHLSEDGTRIIQYLNWKNKQAHKRCTEDPRWFEHEPSRHFIDLMKSGKIKVKAEIFNIQKVVEER